MKQYLSCMIFVLFYVLWNSTILCLADTFSVFNSLSNFPAGPYIVNFDHVNYCKNKEVEVAFQLYANNHTRFRVNLSSSVDIDDTIFLGMNLSFKKSNSEPWKENIINYKSPYICTSVKNIFGSQFSTIAKAIGCNPNCCPLKKGFYVSSDLDISMMKNMNIPKTFVYGTYKLYTYLSRKNNQILGCNHSVIRIIAA